MNTPDEKAKARSSARRQRLLARSLDRAEAPGQGSGDLSVSSAPSGAARDDAHVSSSTIPKSDDANETSSASPRSDDANVSSSVSSRSSLRNSGKKRRNRSRYSIDTPGAFAVSDDDIDGDANVIPGATNSHDVSSSLKSRYGANRNGKRRSTTSQDSSSSTPGAFAVTDDDTDDEENVNQETTDTATDAPRRNSRSGNRDRGKRRSTLSQDSIDTPGAFAVTDEEDTDDEEDITPEATIPSPDSPRRHSRHSARNSIKKRRNETGDLATTPGAFQASDEDTDDDATTNTSTLYSGIKTRYGSKRLRNRRSTASQDSTDTPGAFEATDDDDSEDEIHDIEPLNDATSHDTLGTLSVHENNDNDDDIPPSTHDDSISLTRDDSGSHSREGSSVPRYEVEAFAVEDDAENQTRNYNSDDNSADVTFDIADAKIVTPFWNKKKIAAALCLAILAIVGIVLAVVLTRGDGGSIPLAETFPPEPTSSPSQSPTEAPVDWFQIGQEISGGTNVFTVSATTLSRQGNVAAVTDYIGRVGIFHFVNETWFKVASLEGEGVPKSVAMSSDSSIIAVGYHPEIIDFEEDTTFNGRVRVFGSTQDQTTYSQLGSDILGASIEDKFGWSVSLSGDGTRLAVGSRNACSAKVFDFASENSEWAQIGSGTNCSDFFVDSFFLGTSVRLSEDGETLVVGLPVYSAGPYLLFAEISHVAVFSLDADRQWSLKGQKLPADFSTDSHGRGVAISNDGSIIAIGSPTHDGPEGPESRQPPGNPPSDPDRGLVRVLVYDDTTESWVQQGDDLLGESFDDHFGTSVDLSSDGSIIAIGVPGSNTRGNGMGEVYLYEFSNEWTLVGSRIPGFDSSARVGSEVALSSDGSRVLAASAVSNINTRSFNSFAAVRVLELMKTM